MSTQTWIGFIKDSAICQPEAGMNKSIRKAIICVLSILGTFFFLQACTTSYPLSPSTLAEFFDNDNSLHNLIAYPNILGDVDAVIYCVVDVTKRGGLANNHCIPSEKLDQAFHRSIDTAAKAAKAIPATVAGKGRSVHLYYRVHFVGRVDASEIHVYLNWGFDVDKYGPDYKAPQRYSRYRYPRVCVTSRDRFIGFATVVIGADGMPKSEVVVDPRNPKPKERCTISIKKITEQAKYIPGQSEGTPVEASFVENWGVR